MEKKFYWIQGMVYRGMDWDDLGFGYKYNSESRNPFDDHFTGYMFWGTIRTPEPVEKADADLIGHLNDASGPSTICNIQISALGVTFSQLYDRHQNGKGPWIYYSFSLRELNTWRGEASIPHYSSARCRCVLTELSPRLFEENLSHLVNHLGLQAGRLLGLPLEGPL